MDYAIVEDGIVINIAVADSPVEDNWIVIDGVDVHIGDMYDGESFFRDGDKVLTEEEMLRIENSDMQAALEILGVTVDG